MFHNSIIFGSCIIGILYTGCAKTKKNNSGSKRLIHPSSGACDLFVELFNGLYYSGTIRVGVNVVVWLGWCGVRMQVEELFFIINRQDDARSNKQKIETFPFSVT